MTKINILYRKFVPYNIQEEEFGNWKNSSPTWIRKRYSNGPTTREHEKEGRAITYQIREMYGGVNSPIKVELTIFLSGPDWYRLSSSEALSCKHEQLFDLLTLVSSYFIIQKKLPQGKILKQKHNASVLPSFTWNNLLFILQIFYNTFRCFMQDLPSF